MKIFYRIFVAEMLKFEYGFYMTLAYLASHADDALAAAEHENTAHAVERRLAQLRIQS